MREERLVVRWGCAGEANDVAGLECCGRLDLRGLGMGRALRIYRPE
jgi:hypothetical protein